MPKMTCRGIRRAEEPSAPHLAERCSALQPAERCSALHPVRTQFGPTNAGRRPTVHRMNPPDDWLGKSSKLRVDRARGDPAPRPMGDHHQVHVVRRATRRE